MKGESVRTVEQCLEQIEQFNPLVNSVLTVLADQALAVQKEPIALDAFGGRIHVEQDPAAAVTPLGQLPFFIEFLKVSGLFDAWVADCPLSYRSNNAPDKRVVLATFLLSILAGHHRYRTTRTCNKVYGEVVLEDLSRRLASEFGHGFDVSNLRKMRQFYRMIQILDAMRLESGKTKRNAPHLVSGMEEIRHTACDELSWSHYRLLMQVATPSDR